VAFFKESEQVRHTARIDSQSALYLPGKRRGFTRKMMNRSELIAQIAAKSGLTKADSEKALSATIEAITESMKNGEEVSLVGFGSFAVGERAARTGRNPQTGAKIKINASKVPKFKPGKTLKDALNLPMPKGSGF
jgi:integration host factor beta subunit